MLRSRLSSGQRMGARWRHTNRTPARKQDPTHVATATQTLDAWKMGGSETVHALRTHRIYLYHLLSQRAQPNDVEANSGVVKRQKLPERPYPTGDALEDAVSTSFTHIEQRLLGQTKSVQGKQLG